MFATPVKTYPLELSGLEFAELVALATARLGQFLDTLPEQPIQNLDRAVEFSRQVSEPLPTGGQPFDQLIEQLFRDVFPVALNTTSPGYLAYIPGGGLPHSAIADLLSLIANRYVGLWSAAPVVSQIEATVVRWLCDIIGYGEGSGGFLTSGGSLANWAALVLARERLAADQFHLATIYTSTQAHHSVAKAARLAGIPSQNVRALEVDRQFRLRTERIVPAIARDRDQGQIPLAIVAQAGATNTGAVDDLQTIADLAAAQQLWLHTDAAYGGFFLLTERGRQAMRGIELADSVTLDPHKGLFLPYGTGGLLVRDKACLSQTFAGRGEYMTAKASDEFIDFCDLSPELSRDFRGLRLWLPLKMHGIEPFRECLDEKLDLAQYAAEELRRIENLEIVAAPQLSITAFRLRPAGLSEPQLTELNREFLARINAPRRVLLTSTTLDGRFVIRICVLSFRTHRDRIEECLELIRQAAGALSLDLNGS